jgi:hypothetical protein
MRRLARWTGSDFQEIAMPSSKDQAAHDAPATPAPAGQEAPPHPAQDPTRKTDATTDPTAEDPGNGAD